jgi:hypothetical protein
MTHDPDRKRVLTEEQEKALERINMHLECIKDTINANWDKGTKEHWLTLDVDHNNRSNGDQFKEDIEPRVRRLRVF